MVAWGYVMRILRGSSRACELAAAFSVTGMLITLGMAPAVRIRTQKGKGMKALMAGMTLALLSTTAGADDYSGVPQRLFEQIQARQFDKAIDTMGVKKDMDPEDRQQMVQYMSKAFGGEYKFHELIEERTVGTRYVTLVYLVGMREGPAGLRMQLYKPDETWLAQTFAINSDYDELVKEKKKD
ncbi:hypothetical protein ASF84_26645 [Pseudomonas sp. Leaf127]|nr:hypothetical protein ASF84_26645 [Pseudomonas sp. Leaf127]